MVENWKKIGKKEIGRVGRTNEEVEKKGERESGKENGGEEEGKKGEREKKMKG